MTTDTTTGSASEMTVVPFIFFLLGIGVLVPWNTFISLKSYYENRFCSEMTTTSTTTDVSNGSYHENNDNKNSNMESIFSTVYNLSSILTMILLISSRLLRDHQWKSHCRCFWFGTPSQYEYNTIVPTDNISNSTSLDNDEVDDNSHRHSSTTVGAVEISDESEYNTDRNDHNHHHPVRAQYGWSSRNIDRAGTSITATVTNTSTTKTATIRQSSAPVQHLSATGSVARLSSSSSSPRSSEVIDNTIDTVSFHYSFWFVILPFLITIGVFMLQLVLVMYVQSSIPFHFNMYTITLFCIATCGVTSALLGTGIITVISTSSSMIPFHQTMNPYQFGISVAGVAVSVINLLIAMTKDPTFYFATYCSNSNSSNSTSASSLLSLWPSEHTEVDSNYSWTTIERDRATYRSIIAATNSHPPNTLPIQQSITCQQYNTIDYTVFCYFLIGIVVLFTCLCGFIYIQQNVVLKQPPPAHPHDFHEEDINDLETIPAATTTPTINIDRISRYDDDSLLNTQRQGANEMNHLMSTTLEDDPVVATTTSSFSSPSSTEVAGIGIVASTPASSFITVFRYVYGPTGGIFITFCITLGLFPSWTAGLRSIYECDANNYTESSHSYSLLTRYSNDLYVPFTFVLFNVGDLLGRIMSTTLWFQLTATTSSDISKKLLFYACTRLVFFPLLLICPTSMHRSFGLTVHSDVYSLVVQLLFAMSNGYIIATSFTQAPKLLLNVEGHQQQEKMSEMLSCAVNFGLFAGSLLSLLVSQLSTTVIPNDTHSV